MRFGRFYEEFDLGAVYRHWPGKTVTEYDNHLFCQLTMNHHSLLLGMSVADASGKAVANLEVQPLRHVAPVFHGDTVHAEPCAAISRTGLWRPSTARAARPYGPGARPPTAGRGGRRSRRALSAATAG